MTRKELKRRIRAAWSKYEDTLRDLLRPLGKELHGLASAHKTIGAPADLAYEVFKQEQKRIQNEYGAAVDAKLMARGAKKRAEAAWVAELDQAQRDVLYQTQRCEQERTRAKMLMKYCGASEEEAARIVEIAEGQLAACQKRLEGLRA